MTKASKSKTRIPAGSPDAPVRLPDDNGTAAAVPPAGQAVVEGPDGGTLADNPAAAPTSGAVASAPEIHTPEQSEQGGDGNPAIPADSTGLRITSRREGFRRAGLAHPTTATEHALSDFSPAQLAQLLGEPELEVEFF